MSIPGNCEDTIAGGEFYPGDCKDTIARVRPPVFVSSKTSMMLPTLQSKGGMSIPGNCEDTIAAASSFQAIVKTQSRAERRHNGCIK
jgi:hypothetical protein